MNGLSISFIRLVRYVLFNIALFLPSIYVALTTYHPKLIPTKLLISIAAAREGVPFPTIVEALLMEFVFEGLREAGIRLPKAVGSAVSIVGALVIGQLLYSRHRFRPDGHCRGHNWNCLVFDSALQSGNCTPAYKVRHADISGNLWFLRYYSRFYYADNPPVNLRSFGVPYFIRWPRRFPRFKGCNSSGHPDGLYRLVQCLHLAGIETAGPSRPEARSPERRKEAILKKIILRLGLCLSVLFISGCWDRKELNEQALWIGSGWDVAKNDDIELSGQIVIPANIQTQGGGGVMQKGFFQYPRAEKI